MKEEDADWDIGVSGVGKAFSSKIGRKGYFHKQSFCLLSPIIIGKGYESGLFHIFFGSQTD